MIANLMMYARPQLDGVHERYWQLIREYLSRAGIGSPEHLSQEAEEFSVWQHPDLVLSQTCGMPYRKWLHDKVWLVGTPDYDLDGCPPGYYRNALVVRANDSRGDLDAYRKAVFAYNQTFSQSGYAAPYWHLAPHGFWFESQLQTEGHLKSARAVAKGDADIAALDAVSWRLIEAHEEFESSLRVLDWTKPTPGLPLITAQGNDTGTIFDAVRSAIGQLDPTDRSALGLQGIVRIPKEQYTAIPNPPEQA